MQGGCRGWAGQWGLGGWRGASVLYRMPARAQKLSPAEAPSWDFPTGASHIPRGPGEQEGLGVNGGVRLAAEGTRGVGYGAI